MKKKANNRHQSQWANKWHELHSSKSAIGLMVDICSEYMWFFQNWNECLKEVLDVFSISYLSFNNLFKSYIIRLKKFIITVFLTLWNYNLRNIIFIFFIAAVINFFVLISIWDNLSLLLLNYNRRSNPGRVPIFKEIAHTILPA